LITCSKAGIGGKGVKLGVKVIDGVMVTDGGKVIDGVMVTDGVKVAGSDVNVNVEAGRNVGGSVEVDGRNGVFVITCIKVGDIITGVKVTADGISS
jgi:hypothetical protein